MPNYKGHLAAGFALYALLVLLIGYSAHSLPTLLEWLVCILFGSLFPDVDTKSKGQKIFYSVLAGIYIVLLLQQNYVLLSLLAVCALLPLLVRHRGLTHSIWFIFAICAGAIVYAYCAVPSMALRVLYDSIFFGIGALSHIILDVGVKRAFRV